MALIIWQLSQAHFASQLLTSSVYAGIRVSPWIKISAWQKERITFTICACDMMLFFLFERSKILLCSAATIYRKRYISGQPWVGKKKAFQERHFVIEWSFKTLLYACTLVWKPGDIPFQPNISAVCITQDVQSLFNSVLLADFKSCHRNNNKRPVVETTSFPSQRGKESNKVTVSLEHCWGWGCSNYFIHVQI